MNNNYRNLLPMYPKEKCQSRQRDKKKENTLTQGHIYSFNSILTNCLLLW